MKEQVPNIACKQKSVQIFCLKLIKCFQHKLQFQICWYLTKD